MKILKKNIVICLLLSSCLLFSACSKDEEITESNDTQIASEETIDKDSILTGEQALEELKEVVSHIENINEYDYLDMDLVVNTLTEDNPIEVEINIQSNTVNKEDPIFKINLNLPLIGDVDVYYKDGYAYAEVFGIKSKEAADMNSIYSSYNTVTSFDKLDEIKDLTVSFDADGNKTFEYNYVSHTNIDLNSITNGLSDFNISDDDILYTVIKTDKDNNILNMHMYSTAKNSDEKTLTIDIIFNSLNTPFEIDLPDFSNYN